MEFNQKDYSEIKNIILKISNNKSISLDEIILLQNYVNNHSEILHQFKKAQSSRGLNHNNIENLTKFMADLALDGIFQP